MKLVALALVLASYPAFAQTPPPLRFPVDAALPDYQRISGVAGVLRTVGSSTLSNLLLRWGAEFQRFYPTVQVEVTGGGSETALAALLEGRADLGPMSRPMTDVELKRFHDKFGYPPTRVTAVVDAVAVYVNKRNPLSRMSFRELEGIYSANRNSSAGPIRQWGQLGLNGEWETKTIEIKGPSPAQGIYSVFRAAVLGGADYRLEMRPEPVASSIVQAVATEDGAIGFASHFLAAARTKTLAVSRADGGTYALPTPERAIDGSYPLARKLFIYVNRPPGASLSSVVREFLRYVCSEQGQEVAARDGNFPLDATLAAQECAIFD
jgi:phosphate transport system substrate-binding protein